MNGTRYQNTGASASAYASTIPSRTASGSPFSVCGSMLLAEAAASPGAAPAPANPVVRFSVRRVVNSVPKTAVPSAAPTSRK